MEPTNKSIPIIGKKVIFIHGQFGEQTGIVIDKVCVPIASGTNEYVQFTQYVIELDNGNIFIINPIELQKVITK